jgi:hypothetical protein
VHDNEAMGTVVRRDRTVELLPHSAMGAHELSCSRAARQRSVALGRG